MKKLTAMILCAILCLTGMEGIAFAAEKVKVTAVSETEIEIGSTQKKLEPVAGTENLIVNGGFDTLSADGTPEGWTSRCYNLANGTGASVVKGVEARNGNAVKLVGGDIPANYPFVTQNFSTMGKATYQMSVWVRKDGGTSPCTVKLEFWPEMLPGATTVMEANTFSIVSTNGSWQEVLYNFVAPFTAKSVGLLARLQNSDGDVVYFDDISVYMVRPPECMDIKTDSNFYYPEQTDGVATATILTDFFPEAKGGSVDFALLDGDKELCSLDNVVLDEKSKAAFPFKTSHLTELKKEYTIKGVLKDKDGNVITESTEPLYKFNRPKFLKADGTFQADGEEPILPVITYSAWTPDYFPPMKEAGITVVQGNEDMLEEAGKNGMKILMVLYPDMKAAGDPDIADWTREIVTKYKDDPRVFGWAVMDEPYLNLLDPHDVLRESYRIIREIDDNHPVYICEASSGHYAETTKNCDVLCIDPYLPATQGYAGGQMNTTHVYEMTQKARAASGYLKPVVSLLQAFEWYGYLPTADAERHMIYETLLAGSKGIGYYCMSNAYTKDGRKVPLYATGELWDGIVAFSENEAEDAHRHFVLREYAGFNHYVGDDIMYHGYVKGNYLYMIVLNQSITDSVTAEIPLTSFDGSITIDNYFGEYLFGGEGKNIKGKTDTLKVTLKPHAATVLKVSPRRATDFSVMDQDAFWAYFESVARGEEQKTEPYFTDLANYDWAAEAIEALYKEKIINKKGEGLYAPADKITRGDFAMFLVNTLGLTAETETENFADVDPAAEYANAVSVGKAAGVLNGVGENMYMPEAEITRQDLMTICYRGIQLVKTLADGDTLTEDSFPDWGSVADYAASAISAMVREEIVKGNADGTLNPLGNTTRAEAAVIMERIIKLTK